MSAAPAKLLVLAGKEFACIKIVGRANFSLSMDLKTLVNQLVEKGYRYFVLELSECLLMDSTFLGVLAGFGLRMNRNTGCEPPIELLNANTRVSELLENLGVLHLFRLAQGKPDCSPEDLQIHTSPGATREEVTRACIEAHQTLMEIDPKNVAKFKDVNQFLAEDLKRMTGLSR